MLSEKKSEEQLKKEVRQIVEDARDKVPEINIVPIDIPLETHRGKKKPLR